MKQYIKTYEQFSSVTTQVPSTDNNKPNENNVQLTELLEGKKHIEKLLSAIIRLEDMISSSKDKLEERISQVTNDIKGTGESMQSLHDAIIGVLYSHGLIKNT